MSKSISNHFTRKRIHFPYEIAICCFHPAIVVLQYTLSILKAYKVPFSKVTLFVETSKQKEEYRKRLPAGSYRHIRVAGNGRSTVYTFLQSYYPIGTRVVCITDCIKAIYEYDESSKNNRKPLASLCALIEFGFSKCQNVGSAIWGIYPGDTPLNDVYQTDICLLPFSIWGYIQGFTDTYIYKTSSCLEYERSLVYYDTVYKCVRINSIVADTVYPNGKLDKEELKLLEKVYPQYIQIKNGEPNLKHLHTVD